jgi:hypothetical protein
MIKTNDIAQSRVIQFRCHFLLAELITILDLYTYCRTFCLDCTFSISTAIVKLAGGKLHGTGAYFWH